MFYRFGPGCCLVSVQIPTYHIIKTKEPHTWQRNLGQQHASLLKNDQAYPVSFGLNIKFKNVFQFLANFVFVSFQGATTLATMTLSITTLSITTLTIITLSVMTRSMVLGVLYAECRVFNIALLSVIMVNVVFLSFL
jgi:hypothetical protein